MESDFLKPQDNVRVSVLNETTNGEPYVYEGTGYRDLAKAIDDAYRASGFSVSPEDCVFTVADLSTGVSHRYRFNAHGHLILLPEEY